MCLDYLLFIVSTLLLTTHTNAATECYKCTTTRPPLHSGEPSRLCAEFDRSPRFVVACPRSTYCMKRFFSAQIAHPINATERDCAPQTFITRNYTKASGWREQLVIEEPYQAGCALVDDKGLRTSRTLECYCDSSLCNSTDAIKQSATFAFCVFIFLSLL